MEDDAEMGQILNKYFASVFTVGNGNIMCNSISINEKIDDAGLIDVKITEANVRKAIGNLKLNNAEGVASIN